MPNLLLPYQELPIVTNLIIAHFQAARASKRWWAQGSWGVAWWCQPPSRAPPPPAWWSPSSTPPPWVVTDTNKFNGKHELHSTKVDSSTNLPSTWSKTCYRKMAHLIDCMSPCVIQYISHLTDYCFYVKLLDVLDLHCTEHCYCTTLRKCLLHLAFHPHVFLNRSFLVCVFSSPNFLDQDKEILWDLLHLGIVSFNISPSSCRLKPLSKMFKCAILWHAHTCLFLIAHGVLDTIGPLRSRIFCLVTNQGEIRPQVSEIKGELVEK